MNIYKTNPMGIFIIDHIFNRPFDRLEGVTGDIEFNNEKLVILSDLLKKERDAKVLRLTKRVIDNAKLISFDSIKNNIEESKYDFKSLIILLDKDESGIIKVERIASDFHFIFIKNIEINQLEKRRLERFVTEINSYSFLNGNFQREENEDSILVIQILTYLMYGEIITKNLPPKTKIKTGEYFSFLNNSKTGIVYVDSIWKQRVNVSGFKVSGHFRLQPIGECRKERKLIWIEEFEKHGYNRRATREIEQNQYE